MQTVLIGNPDDLRLKLFQESLREQQQAPAEIISYQAIMQSGKALRQAVRTGSLVRIESPDKDFESNRLLLALGAKQEDEGGSYARMAEHQVLELQEDKGLILVPRQWYLGFAAFLDRLKEQLTDCPAHRLMNHPDEILLMFDKNRCHAHLEANQIPVPKSLGLIQSFDELESRMQAAKMRRVFVKLAHGSSASGVVAYQTNGSEHRATAAMELHREGKQLKLYNSRQIRTYHDYSDIAALIDRLAQHRVHVEQWIPKARMEGKAFDMRVLVVGGKAAHAIARLSSSPMTNLHLLNERRPREALIAQLGAARFDAVMTVCERAMACFPNSVYAGIDVLLDSGKKAPFVIEMNAFGDLLKDSFYEGLSPYALEIQRMASDEDA